MQQEAATQSEAGVTHLTRRQVLQAGGAAALGALPIRDGSAASVVQRERQAFAMSQAEDDAGSATEGSMRTQAGTEITPFQIAIDQDIGAGALTDGTQRLFQRLRRNIELHAAIGERCRRGDATGGQ